MDYYRSSIAGDIPIIEDNTDPDYLFPTEFGRGYDPSQYIRGMLAPPSEIEEISESDLEAILKEEEEQESSLEHLWLRAKDGQIPECLDQNGDGYCWGYSCGSAMMVQRAKMNMPFVRLNPHSTCSIIKNGRNEGGWCGLSCQWVEKNGMAEEGNGPGQWPAHSKDYSLFNRPDVKESMLKYQVTETWADLAANVYDRNLTEKQLRSVIAGQKNPCQVDFNWWGHSVCAIRIVKVEAGSFGLLILNSWKGWGRHGLSVLRGSKARPDGAVCPRAMAA